MKAYSKYFIFFVDKRYEISKLDLIWDMKIIVNFDINFGKERKDYA